MTATPALRGERRQAWARLLLALALTGVHAAAFAAGAAADTGLLVATFYGAAALVLLGWAVRARQDHPWRRGLAVAVDGAAIVGILGGLDGGPALAALAYGLLLVDGARRYGRRALGLGSAVALAGLVVTAVIQRGDPGSLPGLLLGAGLLVLLAISLARLLARLELERIGPGPARRDMLSSVGQELQTPLNGVLGLTGLLRKTPLTGPQQDLVEAILHASRGLLGTLDAALDLARLRAGERTPGRQDFALEAPVFETLDALGPEAWHRGRTLRVYCDPALPAALRGDGASWRRLLLLVLGSGLRTARTPILDVVVSLDRVEGDRLQVGFRVFDGEPRPGEVGVAGAPPETWLIAGLAEALGGRVLAAERATGLLCGCVVPLCPSSPAGPPALQGLRCALAGVEPALAQRLVGWGVETLATPPDLDRAPAESDPPDLVLVGAVGLSAASRERLARWGAPLALIGGTAPATPEARARACAAGYFAVLEDSPSEAALSLTLARAAALHRRGSPEAPAGAHLRPVEGGLDILLAQPDPEAAAVARRALEAAGHRVRRLVSGEEALRVLESERFDLALLDADLPMLPGLQVARLFRMMRPERRTLPLVLLARVASPALEQACAQQSNVRVLASTGGPEALLAYVERFQRAAPTPPSAGAAPRFTLVTPVRRAPLLDTHTLDELMSLNDDPAFLAELVGGFVEDGRRSLEEMDRACSAGEFGALAEQAYALKGSARSIGASALAEACSSLGRPGVEQAEGARELGAARRLFEETSAALDAYLEREAQARN